MKKRIIISCLALAAVMFAVVVMPNTYAEGSCEAGKNGVSISPVSQPFSISASVVLDSEFSVKNMSAEATTFTVTAAPYTMSNEDYTAPNFSNSEENYTRYTQIARWIKFENADGEYVDTLNIDVEGCGEKDVKYKIEVPDSIPNGGQYAVILVKSASSNNSGSIKTVPQVGLLVSARATGETIRESEISDVTVAKTYSKEEAGKSTVVNKINASGSVKNTGNVDLEIKSKMTVKNVFGGVLYENEASVSVLPETTRKVSDVWDGTPLFGLFWVSYTVTSNGQTQDSVKLLLVMPFWMIVLLIILIAVVVMWIIVAIKKRRARKARFMV